MRDEGAVFASGGTMPAVLNAANEVAVDQFLQSKIRYTEIATIIEACLEKTAGMSAPSLDTLDAILALDQHVRRLAHDWCLLNQ